MAEPTNVLADALLGKTEPRPTAQLPLTAQTPAAAPVLPTYVAPEPVAPTYVPTPTAAPLVPETTPVPVPAAPTPVATAGVPVTPTNGSRGTFFIILLGVAIGAILLAIGSYWAWQQVAVSPNGAAVVPVQRPEPVVPQGEIPNIVVIPDSYNFFVQLSTQYPNQLGVPVAGSFADQNFTGELFSIKDSERDEFNFWIKLDDLAPAPAGQTYVLWARLPQDAYLLGSQLVFRTVEGETAAYGAATIPLGEKEFSGVTVSLEPEYGDDVPEPLKPTQKVLDVAL